MSERRRVLYLIDGSAQFYRAYHAIRGLATTRGLPTNATYGFTTMLRKLLQDEKPQFIAISFDPPGKTQRHVEYTEYKANRPKMADDLAVQIPYVRRVCDVFRLPMLEVPGHEADDTIATLVKQALEQGARVVVVSGDKDLLQLVDDDVKVLNPGREGSGSTLYDAKTVEEKFGVPPARVVDVLALVGDSVDNIPGVAGIGDKGARDLIKEYGSLEAVLDNAEKVKRASYREGLIRDRDNAILSKHLITLRRDVPITLDIDALVAQELDRAAAYELFRELEFVALAKEYAPEVGPAGTTTLALQDPAAIAAAVAEARAAGDVAVALLLSAKEPVRARPIGVGLAWKPGAAIYVPLGHDFLGGPDAASQAQGLAALKPLFEDDKVRKKSANVKHDLIVLGRAGIDARGYDVDALVATYLMNPGKRAYTLDDLTSELGGTRPQPRPEGRLSDVPVETAAAAAGSEADLLLRLAPEVIKRLSEQDLFKIYEEMELPLIDVLADMERAGVKIDRPLLQSMSREMERRIAALTSEIHALAGGDFNINSPIQLREVLFDRLGLRSAKKTAKTRAMSTAEDVLEELQDSHELPRKILEYRSVQKLKSTYVDALPELIHPETGRIHASFNQTVAATGRISASDPNLQNIPIRTAEGRRIREAFIAEPGWLLLSADYSQIELRILAHLSSDATLIDAFQKGEDIHDRTSREIFGPFSPIAPDEQRRRSKMVNYALVYGKSAFTLAKDIGVSRTEAAAFIEAYFGRYKDVRTYIDDTLAGARATGHVRTLLGRLRRLPDINSRNFQIRAEAERQAVNAPVQGSAADLIKKAMIDLHRELGERSLKAKLILQIHDELLFEVPEAEAETTRALVKAKMQDALTLKVPLVVEARLGPNWAAVH